MFPIISLTLASVTVLQNTIAMLLQIICKLLLHYIREGLRVSGPGDEFLWSDEVNIGQSQDGVDKLQKTVLKIFDSKIFHRKTISNVPCDEACWRTKRRGRRVGKEPCSLGLASAEEWGRWMGKRSSIEREKKPLRLRTWWHDCDTLHWSLKKYYI